MSGVDGVVALSENSPTGTMPVGTDAPPPPFPTTVALEPTVVDGRVMLQATLSDAADSADAEQTIRDLRDAVHSVDDAAIVGGVTATAAAKDDVWSYVVEQKGKITDFISYYLLAVSPHLERKHSIRQLMTDK